MQYGRGTSGGSRSHSHQPGSGKQGERSLYIILGSCIFKRSAAQPNSRGNSPSCSRPSTAAPRRASDSEDEERSVSPGSEEEEDEEKEVSPFRYRSKEKKWMLY